MHKSLITVLCLLCPAAGFAQTAPAAKPLPAFANIKVDMKTITRRPTPVEFGEAKFPVALDTPHFIVAGTPKVKPASVTVMADALERLRLQMETDLPFTKEALGSQKMLYLLCEDEEQMGTLQKWVVSDGYYRFAGDRDWTKMGCVSFDLSENVRNGLGIIEDTRAFKVTSYKLSDINRPAWTTRIHFTAGDMFREALEKAADNGRFGTSRLELGYSYFCEWRACGKIDTQVSYGSDRDSVQIFEKAKGWHSIIRKMVEDGIKPTLETVLADEASKAHPRDAGAFFAFISFMHSSPVRLSAFNEALKKAVDAKQCPDLETFAKDLGFDSVSAFETEWLKYIRGPYFR